MAAQRHGKITTWNDDKGFGFIAPDDGSENVFFHISAVSKRGVRPAKHAAVSYSLSYDAKRRPRAENIQFDHPPLSQAGRVAALMLLLLLALIAATLLIPLSPLVPIVYVVMSAITFGSYGIDKSSAQKGERRVPEQSLHLLELLGGWPGALVAQVHYAHKTRKESFQLVFRTMVLLNLLVLAGYCALCILQR